MPVHGYNFQVATTAKAPVLSWFRFTVGSTGAVGTIRQCKSNFVYSITRNSAGNYTVQFNAPYPINVVYCDARVNRTAATDLMVDVDYDFGSYSATTGQLTLVTSSRANHGTFATGTITCVTNANMADTDYITIGDGVNPVVLYEYDKAADGVTAGRVNWAAGASTAADVATTLKTAIEANQPSLTVTRADGVLTLTSKIPGTAPNVTITENVANAGFLVTGLSGGATTGFAPVAADPVTGTELSVFFVAQHIKALMD